MKLSRKILAILIIITITGCGSTLEKIAGSGIVSNNIDQFTNERVITMSVTPNYNTDNEIAHTFFDAKWVSSRPDSVLIGLVNKSSTSDPDTYVSYQSVAINIDGDITEFKAAQTTHDSGTYNTVSKSIFTSSRSHIRMPLAYLTEVVYSPSTKIRITTRKYYEDIDMSYEKNSLGVRNARPILRTFLNEINRESY